MAPAGNNKHSQPAMNQTFYLTNIVPQVLIAIYCKEDIRKMELFPHSIRDYLFRRKENS